MEKKIGLFLKSLLGALIYCIGYNYFVKMSGVYASGFMGIAQLIAYFCPKTNIDFQGIIYFALNLPLFCIALKVFGKRYIGKSIVIVAFESFILSILPPLSAPIFDEVITSCLIGGLIEGIGIGIIYQSFVADGGSSLLGMLLIKKIPSLTVGKVSLSINVVLFSICGYLFSVKMALYSVLTMLFSIVTSDYLHKQNKVVSLFVFTDKHKEVCDYIVKTLNRSATEWMGAGAYSETLKHLVYTVMSTYEYEVFKNEIKEIDENAFVVVTNSQISVGKFEKRLNN